MASILLLSGSPSPKSRSSALIQIARNHFEGAGLSTATYGLHDFPAEDLIFARYDSQAFHGLKEHLAQAEAVVVSTPVYKASFSGGLKTILDVLPVAGLRGKTVLPLATGGTLAHQLTIDYALKPVLSALGATDLLQGVYFIDKQVVIGDEVSPAFIDEDIRIRFLDAIGQVVAKIHPATATA